MKYYKTKIKNQLQQRAKVQNRTKRVYGEYNQAFSVFYRSLVIELTCNN